MTVRDFLEIAGAMVGFVVITLGTALLWPPLCVIFLALFTIAVVAGACTA